MDEREVLRRRVAELEAELAALTYAVSHDLRAPVRSIEGFAEALCEDYASRLDDEAHDHLRRILAAARRMDGLVAAMSELARVTSVPLRLQTVDLSTLAGTVAGELQRRAPQRNVTWEIAPGLTAEADPGLLHIVFSHLLGNSLKFTAKQTSARIEVGSEVHEGRHRIFVRDDGVGFNPAQAGKLFKAFQRLHREADFGGLGIGLAVVRRIMQRHDGEVSAVGEVGKGTTVYLAF